ncbi:transglutaminase domain-containing protein [Gemmata sp. JC717]|uniref:transglutaminase domain-containing protein n=1 Tax=Gemmata algarum TaxID=2975278 RepID=UPI0021BA7419|nr:transglutaminase domain-containing protein [Gemmata algarum]MDY3554959.1 transglutaminase domain-containing protein [Gemmata algarum]
MPSRFAFVAVVLFAASALRAADPAPWWDAEVESALTGAKDNRKELEQALRAVPPEQRKGMAFLIANMPDADRAALKAEFLLTNVDLAYKARNETRWGKDVPEELFLNDVLPYANVDEKRDAWRKEFYELCMPMVKDCKTPTEAVQALNAELFKKLKLGYSTQRRAANQSPKESIEQGKASCTGLSIVLSDACRSVGIPARLVGTPLWVDKRGNHTWVEIWDKGWHFTGACEPDPAGLDRGWFVGAAAQAKKDVPEHAIYAASFKKSSQHFPLVWAPRNHGVPGENVTDHYARKAAPDAKAETAKSESALKELRAALEAKPAALADLANKPFAKIPLTKADAATARQLLWDAHAAIIKADRAAEIKDRVIKDDKLEMPFSYKTFGAKPKGGRSLWISMHGGGNAPKQVNDGQWENQKKLYTVEEGIYLAPRAPTNTWNLWHEAHIDRMFARLIEDLIVLEDVNPNRVYVLGYSAGGDGVYQLAPRMADHWAGAAMMAGHPNGVSLLSLRNVPFALQVGGNDSAYNRNKVGKEYGEQLDKLQKDDPKGYEHFVKIHEGKPHWMSLEDKVALPWMAKFTRNPVPEKVVWKQTGAPHDRSYWLAVPKSEAKGDSLVVATRAGQTVEIATAEKVSKLIVRFDDRTADLDKPVEVKQGGKALFTGIAPRTVGTLVKTLADRGDPGLVFDAEVEVTLGGGK